MVKICSKCQIEKNISDFNYRSDRPGVFQSWCKNCNLEKTKLRYLKNKENILSAKKEKRKLPEEKEKIKQYNKQKYIKDKDKHFEYHLIRKYNLKLDDYKNLSEKQNNCCAICNINQELVYLQKLVVDHNHKTGEIRALLCHNCNLMIGYAKDDIKILQNAIKYLQV